MSAPGALRITGGEHRGRRVPLPRNHELRPTSEKARQAFFDIVGPAITDAVFLDLFAGTAVFAMEALSRGAASAVAVESSRPALEQIRASALAMKLELTIVPSDVYRSRDKLRLLAPFDVIYADPPYGDDRWSELLSVIAPLLAEDGIAAIEHWVTNIDDVPDGSEDLVRYRVAKYGTVAISLFRRADSQ